MTGGTSSAAGFDEVIAAPEKPRVCTLAGTSLPVYQWVMEMEEPYLRNSRISERLSMGVAFREAWCWGS
jgi:hypothetical protein